MRLRRSRTETYYHKKRMAVDEAMKETGLKRIECQDVPDPSGMKHKQMRYEGIIDMDSDEVYWR